MTSLITLNGVSTRVSSVLNKDVTQFGKKHMFDGDDETCWNSDQGSPQWVHIKLPSMMTIESIHIQFQGGFVGKQCHIEHYSDGKSDKIADFYPEDVNSVQVFKIADDAPPSDSVRIVFSDSTDFFGRITIYKLEMYGRNS